MIDLTCFGSNYIGIRLECNAGQPTSGLYFNDLPGISLKLASHLADEETIQGVELIRRIEAEAIRSTWIDLQSKLSDDYLLNKLIDQRQVGRHTTFVTPSYLSPVAADVGLKVEKCDCDPLTGIRINYVDIRTNSNVPGKQLKITDGCTETLYDFDAVDCEVTRININYQATQDEVLITVDASDLALENMSVGNGCSCKNDCKCAKFGCFTVDGWNGTNEVGQAYGMAVNVSCECSGTELLCAIQDHIAQAVRLKMGILLMKELLASSRCSFLVQNSKAQANEMLLRWEGGIDMNSGVEIKPEYWRVISQTAKSLKSWLKHQNSKCVSCNTVKVVNSIP